MKQNIHNIERIIRVIIGLALISLVFVGPQTPWGWLGVIPLATGIIGWCPPYALLGISTCKTRVWLEIGLGDDDVVIGARVLVCPAVAVIILTSNHPVTARISARLWIT